MASLELCGLTKVYPTGERAVDGVDLTVPDGALAVVVGPSGCGKSTLLRLIAGLEAPTAGDVLIGGVSMRDVDTRDRDLAMVFQTYALYPHLTVEQNLAFPLMVTGHSRRATAERVREVAEALQLGELLDRKPSKLSGGQRQRVAMGRAIVRRPRLFLLDEPLSNLDTKLRVETRAAIMRLQRRLGVTTVFVTHDQVEALAMADELAVMRSGRVVQHGPPLDVYDEPDDLFVGTFLGGPPMGVVQAVAVGDGGDAGDAEGLRIGPYFVAWPGLAVRGTVLAGIRPEALRVDADGPLLASAVGIDDLGRERVVRIAVPDASGAPSIVHLIVGPTGRFGGWEPIRLAVDVDRVRLFDPVTRRRLDPAGRATGVAAATVQH